MLNSTVTSTNPYANAGLIPPVVGGGVGLGGVYSPQAAAMMTTTTAETAMNMLPFYNSQNMIDGCGDPLIFQHMPKSAAVAVVKDDSSGVTFNNNNNNGGSSSIPPLPRKRSVGDSSSFLPNAVDVSQLMSARAGVSKGVVGPMMMSRCSGGVVAAGEGTTSSSPVTSFLGEDLSLQMMQHQLEADRLISLHTEKVRLEMENHRRNQSRRIIDAISKRVREKEDEIDKIGKMNWMLEERVKSLIVENQIWRDLAQTNKATANALRSNLEQVLLARAASNNDNNVDGGQYPKESIPGDERVVVAVEERAESCCGSSSGSGGGEEAGGEDEVEGCAGGWRRQRRRIWEEEGGEDERRRRRMCRKCGESESSVLLLPCRHLCVCAGCGTYVDTCPVCNYSKSATVHVNLF